MSHIPSHQGQGHDVEFNGADEIDFYERAKFVPMRLTYDERKYLRLIDATVHVSKYTDHLDNAAGARLNPARKLALQMKQLCAILTGLQVAQSYEQGQQLMQSREYSGRSPFFQTVLEIGRRYKILNPERIGEESSLRQYKIGTSHLGMFDMRNVYQPNSNRSDIIIRKNLDCLNTLLDMVLTETAISSAKGRAFG